MRSSVFLALFTLLSLALVTPCHAVGQVQIPDRFKGIILQTVEPDYHRMVGGTGTVRDTGVYRLTINPRTGMVDEVGVLKRCWEKRLDAAAVWAFLQWKFKPGAIKQIDIPVIYDRFVDVQLKGAVVR